MTAVSISTEPTHGLRESSRRWVYRLVTGLSATQIICLIVTYGYGYRLSLLLGHWPNVFENIPLSMENSLGMILSDVCFIVMLFSPLLLPVLVGIEFALGPRTFRIKRLLVAAGSVCFVWVFCSLEPHRLFDWWINYYD